VLLQLSKGIAMSKKYDALGQYLKARATQTMVRLTFAEIEAIIASKLPSSAYDHRPWWSNNPSNNVMTKVWLAAGFETEQVDMAGQTLVFRNTAKNLQDWGNDPAAIGAAQTIAHALAEEPREFRGLDGKPAGRHPAIGALKGTFTIAPGWDVTRPALDPDELAEWEASLDRKADLYESGLKGKKP
jgi:hypothetical protein